MNSSASDLLSRSSWNIVMNLLSGICDCCEYEYKKIVMRCCNCCHGFCSCISIDTSLEGIHFVSYLKHYIRNEFQVILKCQNGEYTLDMVAYILFSGVRPLFSMNCNSLMCYTFGHIELYEIKNNLDMSKREASNVTINVTKSRPVNWEVRSQKHSFFYYLRLEFKLTGFVYISYSGRDSYRNFTSYISSIWMRYENNSIFLHYKGIPCQPRYQCQLYVNSCCARN